MQEDGYIYNINPVRYERYSFFKTIVFIERCDLDQRPK